MLLVVAVLVPAGCGGSNRETAPPTTTRAPTGPDPARAMRELLDAARGSNATRLGNLLEPDTPDGFVPGLMEGLGSYPKGTPVVLAVTIDDAFAVAAIAGPRTAEGTKEAYAASAVALHRIGDEYKASLVSPVRIRPLGPDEGSTQASESQVAAEFSAPVRLTEAGLWVDGKAIPADPKGSPTRFTAYGSSGKLKPGWHSVVAFAQAGPHAAARAWTFRVR